MPDKIAFNQFNIQRKIFRDIKGGIPDPADRFDPLLFHRTNPAEYFNDIPDRRSSADRRYVIF